MLDWARPEKTGYPLSLAQTWLTSIEQLTEPARALLERLAFLGNEPIPVFLLKVPRPEQEAPEGRDPLSDLALYSLVIRNVEADTFTVHRIVRDVTRRGLVRAGREKERLTEALGWLGVAFVGDPQDVRTWVVLNPLAPHAEAVAGYADKAGIGEPTEYLMGQLAVLLRAKALYGQAEPYYRRTLAIAEASFPAEDPRIATHLNNLAQLLQATNRLGEAEPLMRRALSIDEASYGPDHPNVARDLNNLAQLLQATNRLGEAELLMRRMVAIFLAFQRDTGNAHPHRDAGIANYTGLLRAMGKSRAEIDTTLVALGPDIGHSAGSVRGRGRMPVLARGCRAIADLVRAARRAK